MKIALPITKFTKQYSSTNTIQIQIPKTKVQLKPIPTSKHTNIEVLVHETKTNLGTLQFPHFWAKYVHCQLASMLVKATESLSLSSGTSLCNGWQAIPRAGNQSSTYIDSHPNLIHVTFLHY